MSISPRLGQVLVSLKPELDYGALASADVLRKSGSLSLLNASGTIRENEAFDDKRLASLASANVYVYCVLLGFLSCPMELVRQPPALEVFRSVLSSALSFSLAGIQIVDIVNEYDGVFKSGEYDATFKAVKFCAKGKGLSGEVANSSAAAQAIHRDRRECLRYIMYQTSCTCDVDQRITAQKYLVCGGVSA